MTRAAAVERRDLTLDNLQAWKRYYDDPESRVAYWLIDALIAEHLNDGRGSLQGVTYALDAWATRNRDYAEHTFDREDDWRDRYLADREERS